MLTYAALTDPLADPGANFVRCCLIIFVCKHFVFEVSHMPIVSRE